LRFPAFTPLDEFVEVVVGKHPARPLLAATKVDVSQLAVPNESVELFDAGVQPFGGLLRRPQNTHYAHTKVFAAPACSRQRVPGPLHRRR